MKKILVASAFVLALSACSSTTSSDVQKVVTQANENVAAVSSNLPSACLALAALHDAFTVAAAFSPDVAAQASTEAAVYDGLTNGAGPCSPSTLANPPANVASLVADVVKASLGVQAALKPAAAAAASK